MNYYEVLKIGRDATLVDIKKAYYSLSRKFHPDKNNGSFGEEQKKLNEAYAVLSNPETKKVYDQSLDSPSEQFEPPIILSANSRLFEPEIESGSELLKLVLQFNELTQKILIIELHKFWGDLQNELIKLEEDLSVSNDKDPEDKEFIKKIAGELCQLLQVAMQSIRSYENNNDKDSWDKVIKELGMVQCNLHRIEISLKEKKKFFHIAALFSNQRSYINSLHKKEDRQEILKNVEDIGYQYYRLWTRFVLNRIKVAFMGDQTEAHYRAQDYKSILQQRTTFKSGTISKNEIDIKNNLFDGDKEQLDITTLVVQEVATQDEIDFGKIVMRMKPPNKVNDLYLDLVITY